MIIFNQNDKTGRKDWEISMLNDRKAATRISKLVFGFHHNNQIFRYSSPTPVGSNHWSIWGLKESSQILGNLLLLSKKYNRLASLQQRRQKHNSNKNIIENGQLPVVCWSWLSLQFLDELHMWTKSHKSWSHILVVINVLTYKILHQPWHVCKFSYIFKQY